MAGFWLYSATSQMSSDMTDLEHISLRPWYLEHSCQAGLGKMNDKGDTMDACAKAQARFALAVASL